MKTINAYKILAMALIMAVTVSCSNTQQKKQDARMPPKTYKTIELQPQSITLYRDYPTTLQGQQTVDIRPKISGYIDEILVDEGAQVQKGQILFRLFAKDIQASLRSAQAQVKVAEADVAAAKINLEKTKPLVDKDIISQFDLATVESMVQAKEAQLAQAKAMLANASANLQYTQITSPTNGIIGNFPYREGSLVSSNSTAPLTTVSNTTNMYAYFAMNEKEFLSLIKNLEGTTLQKKLSTLPDVLLVLADNSIYNLSGKIETASGLVDAQTGAINIRAAFANPAGLLRSGSSGLVRIPNHIDSTIIIPQKATYELQGKHFVYVVGDDNKVKHTSINILVGNLKEAYVVTDGLKAGDKIVIEGIASLKNEEEINPEITETPTYSDDLTTENRSNN
ncbi:efflux RND transporter periplasmic adaptor subunit [Geofilum sp. OHC36d9]|uniref:efflux RND transporter periplasmic adaptor subunit n=1 Tax=Geofilum sp. OHC36d9 TaxID=3458413 RepID=UPI00403476E1